MSKEIFALDIGTRKVMGIVALGSPGSLEVLDAEVLEHDKRPMFDGQIHSIEETAKTVLKVKCNLEARLSRRLTHVSVAVAGRNLVVHKTKACKHFDHAEEITQKLVRDLEFEAVEKIITEFGEHLSDFYCVGYSPVYYELDGNRIASLIGHRAKTIASEVIATFLPRVVLDSMSAVLQKSGLEAVNVTLEPISAINAIIPPEIRNLNIILVDIGAGTSDLALTKEGFVFAYGMVPEAGDEITESIAEMLLVDFNTAERIKRVLHNNSHEIEYQDIWGKRCRVEVGALMDNLGPAIQKLADSIAAEGLALNGAPPQAVVVIGGGSLTARLMQALAEAFKLPAEKVGIRTPSMIKGFNDATGILSGPEAVTPIGIALMAKESTGLRFIDIKINGQKIRMLDFLQKKDVLSSLALSGILDHKRLYPRPGLALTVEINGELTIIKGTMGVAASIIRNGQPVSSLSEKVEHGDSIEFKEAFDGQDGQALLKELVSTEPLQVIFNDEATFIQRPVTMNASKVAPDTKVVDRANIQTRPVTLKEALQQQGINVENLSERQILVNINDVPKILLQRSFMLRLNHEIADLQVLLKENDVIEFSFDTPTFYRIRDIIDAPLGFDKMRINVDGDDIEIDVEAMHVLMNGQRVTLNEFLIDGADIKISYFKGRHVLLSDIFKYIEFDPLKGLGKNLKILVNGQPAGFTTPLHEGSRVRFLFEERPQSR